MMNSKLVIPMQASLFCEPTPIPLRLEVKGIVPSFKTQKSAIGWRDKKTGKIFARPFTLPEHKKWMQKTVESFVSQCLSAIQTTESTITTADIRRFLTASLPRDDAWTSLPETHITSELCEPGNEGCSILIERI